MKSLNNLKIGEKGIVYRIENECLIKRRLYDLGLMEGTNIECMLESYKHNPKAFKIKEAIIALRDDDTKHIILG